MNVYDTPNGYEYSWDKKPRGRLLLARILLVLFYIGEVGGFLAVILGPIKAAPLFALCPTLVSISAFYTWRFVKYECYLTFSHGVLTLGKRRRYGAKGSLRSIPLYSITVKDAEGFFLPGDTPPEGRLVSLASVPASSSSVRILFTKDGKRIIAEYETTPELNRLLASYSPAAKELKRAKGAQ